MVQNQQHAWDIFLHLFPTSVVDAMARGDILQLVVFSLFFGIGVAAIGAKGKPILDIMDSTAHAMFKVTGYVMAFAPIGVFAAIAATVGAKGFGILFTLGKLIALMYFGLVIFVLIVVGGVSYLIRVPFLTFVKAIREPFLIAFTTASSEAALPKALEVMERFGVPKNIVSFVLPTGYSFNLDGTTLYLSLASVFVAQLAGMHLTVGQQIVMMLTLMLTSKGVAGVPRSALVVLTATLTQFGLPLEGAAILLGIDQVMDMGRTAVNVMGNCIAAAVVARWEGVFDDARLRAFERNTELPATLYRPVPGD
jgi:proton glutamate symport protein